jgi:FKBP-type peptidyl-prolyl cis-trans isomerase
MIRILAAACAAFLMIAACSQTKDFSDVNAPFEQYLPWDAAGKDVKSAEGGLQYVVLNEGAKGGKSPTATDLVSVNYDGRTAVGEKFDSSFDRGEPVSFKLNQVIPGWTQGLQLMSEGDDYLFYIPTALAYGDNPRPGSVIKPGDDLVFRVQLLEVMEPKVSDTAAWAEYTPWNSERPEVKKTGSGLEYVVLVSGDPSGPSPENGEMVSVHYEGRLAETGDLFDSSFERGEPAVFPSNRLIQGWVEALEMMRPGDRWMLYIPSDLGYGATGTPGGPIPPNAPLVFEVEMMDVMKRS